MKHCKVFGGDLPKSVLREYKLHKVYRTTVSVEGDMELPDEFIELEQRRLEGVAIACARNHYSGENRYLETNAQVLESDTLDKEVEWLANFQVSSSRLSPEKREGENICAARVLAGRIDVDAIGYILKICDN